MFITFNNDMCIISSNLTVLVLIYSKANWSINFFCHSCCTLVASLHYKWNVTRYVDGTPTSEVTPVTIRYIRPPLMVTHVNIMVMNGWLASFSFIVNRLPHSWDKAISDSDLETPRSRSWVWSMGKVIQMAQYHINSLPFHLTSIRPTILQIELFWNLTLKHPRSRSWGRSKVKVTYCTQYPTNALPFRFTSIGPTIPEIWPK